VQLGFEAPRDVQIWREEVAQRIKEKTMKPNQTMHCQGCRNNFYNGNNELGVKECWSFPTAKLIKRKRVHINQYPPWNQKAEYYPDCYQQPQYVFVGSGTTY